MEIGVEPMSNMAGEGQDVEIVTNFNPSELESAMDDSAMGAGAKVKMVKPFGLSIVNSTNATLNAILFGANDYLGDTNFGSPATIAITPTSTAAGNTYERLLRYSSNNPFTIYKWWLQSSNTSQLAQTIDITYVNPNGKSATDYIDMIKDSYQNQDDQLEIEYPVDIDGDTFLTIPILAGATLVMRMYPTAIANITRTLGNGATKQNFSTPKLSGLNVPKITVVANNASVKR